MPVNVNSLDREFDRELDNLLHQVQNLGTHKTFSLDPEENYGHVRNKRSSCPGGVGNLGFNSFNMMTFMLLSLNAVANVNNNINNNNNNNFNINYNTISTDSNNVISNSENMNMVMAMILPVPGKRNLFSNRVERSVREAGNITNTEADQIRQLVLLDDLKWMVEWVSAGSTQCESWRVCTALKSFSIRHEIDVINTELLEEDMNPFLSEHDCDYLFPQCDN